MLFLCKELHVMCWLAVRSARCAHVPMRTIVCHIGHSTLLLTILLAGAAAAVCIASIKPVCRKDHSITFLIVCKVRRILINASNAHIAALLMFTQVYVETQCKSAPWVWLRQGQSA